MKFLYLKDKSIFTSEFEKEFDEQLKEDEENVESMRDNRSWYGGWPIFRFLGRSDFQSESARDKRDREANEQVERFIKANRRASRR